jgi:hypothetical protein
MTWNGAPDTGQKAIVRESADVNFAWLGFFIVFFSRTGTEDPLGT